MVRCGSLWHLVIPSFTLRRHWPEVNWCDGRGAIQVPTCSADQSWPGFNYPTRARLRSRKCFILITSQSFPISSFSLPLNRLLWRREVRGAYFIFACASVCSFVAGDFGFNDGVEVIPFLSLFETWCLLRVSRHLALRTSRFGANGSQCARRQRNAHRFRRIAFPQSEDYLFFPQNDDTITFLDRQRLMKLLKTKKKKTFKDLFSNGRS